MCFREGSTVTWVHGCCSMIMNCKALWSSDPRQVIPTVGSIWPFYMVNESAWFQHRQWHRSSIQFRCRAKAALEALKSRSENAENGMCFSESFDWLRAGKASWQIWDFEMHLMNLIASFASNLTLCSSRLFPLMLSRSVATAVSPLKNPTPCRAVRYPSSGLWATWKLQQSLNIYIYIDINLLVYRRVPCGGGCWWREIWCQIPS